MSEGINEIEVDIHEICQLGDSVSLKEVLNCKDFYPEVLFERDNEGFTAYHLALLYSHSECVSLLLSLNLDLEMPYQGFMPIHLALGFSGFTLHHEAITKTVLTLIQHSQDIRSRDRLGRTALHISAAAGLSSLIPFLIQSGIKLDLKDFSGKMAIHYAIENSQTESLSQILQEGGSDMFFCTDSRGDKPVHLAVRCGSWECFKLLIALGSDEMLNENNEFEQTPEEVAKNCGVYEEYCRAIAGEMFVSGVFKGTLVVTDGLCKLHAALPEAVRTEDKIGRQVKLQPENPKRLEVLVDPCGALMTDEFLHLEWMRSVNKANISDILRVHEVSYVNSVKAAVGKLEKGSLPGKYDIDTVISSESYDAALVAANAVIVAVDRIMTGQCKNAFCAVRPPGHHVGPFGAVGSEEDPGSKSTGFCLFNNIAIGSAYALYNYSSDLQKIAIIDFDVHHGNGTEAIVKNLTPSRFFQDFNLPPFSGGLFYDSYKPWLADSDRENVLFISSHAYGSDEYGKFYPASGTFNSGDDLYPAGILNIPLSKPTDSATFRNCKVYIDYRTKVFPRLLEFAPDILMISAGFDGHGLDVINHGFVDLDEDDYRWITEELIKIANTCCKGRIVSVLEGGYSVKGGVINALGQSVAAHVRALMHANQEHYFGLNSEGDIEKMALKEQLIENLRNMKRMRQKYMESLVPDESGEEGGESGESGENEQESRELQEESNDEDGETQDPMESAEKNIDLGNRTIE